MHDLKRLFLIPLLFLAGPALAEIIEKPVTLPDGLGTGILYTNSETGGKTAGVIVVHEWWGLNDFARYQARRLAEEGYVSFAVDMYGNGKTADHPDDATAFMEASLAEPEKMAARFDAAHEILRKHKQTNRERLFAVGYCFGGGVVLEQARRGVDLAGIASFHGSLGTEDQAQPGDIKARVLVAAGGADPMVPPEQVGQFANEMTAAGVRLELLVFPEAKHSFTNPAATQTGKKFDMPLEYNQEADERSWEALVAMIEESGEQKQTRRSSK